MPPTRSHPAAPTLLQRALDVLDAVGALSALTLKSPLMGETEIRVSIPEREWAALSDAIAYELRLTLSEVLDEQLRDGDGFVRLDAHEGRIVFLRSNIVAIGGLPAARQAVA